MQLPVDLVKQILEREACNLITRINPKFAPFSGAISEHAYKYLEPYLNLLANSEGKVDVDEGAEFAKQKASNEIEAFREKIKREQSGN